MEAKEEKTFEMPAMPQLPDGIGLDFDQVAQLLAEKSKTIVSPDDPMLMMVTLCNAFLAEENKLMERHRKALTEVLATRTAGYVEAVKGVSDGLEKSLASVALVAMQQTFTEHRLELVKHQKNICWLSAITTVSALINVAVFLWR